MVFDEDDSMYKTLSAACDITLALGRRHHTGDYALKNLVWDLNSKGHTQVALVKESSELQYIINNSHWDDVPTDMQHFALTGIAKIHNLDLVEYIEEEELKC